MGQGNCNIWYGVFIIQKVACLVQQAVLKNDKNLAPQWRTRERPLECLASKMTGILLHNFLWSCTWFLHSVLAISNSENTSWSTQQIGSRCFLSPPFLYRIPVKRICMIKQHSFAYNLRSFSASIIGSHGLYTVSFLKMRPNEERTHKEYKRLQKRPSFLLTTWLIHQGFQPSKLSILL